jgi:DNA primase
MVTITGKQEMREENNFSSRQFYKKFSIPQGVKPENITSSLSPQGVLTISAPIDQALANQQAITSSTVTKSQQEVTSQRSVSQQQQVQQQQQQVQQELKQQQQQQIQQELKQQQQHTQQSQQQRQVQQQTVQQQQKSVAHSDSVSSVDSNVSNVSSIHQNIMKRLSEEDFLLRPILDLNSFLDRESRFEDVSKQICQIGSGDKFEVSTLINSLITCCYSDLAFKTLINLNSPFSV